MVNENEPSGGLEWRVKNMTDGTSKVLSPECTGLSAFFMGFLLKIRSFIQKACKIGTNEPRKLIHCLKVGMALSFVSLFYYMRPLYEGLGGNAMWAVLTVVVVFEYTVGATIYKCVNRASGTFLAGALGVGVHWVARQSGERFEPIILQGSVFILASAATFSRFIPLIKARFDYGALIFILTFSLVSVSGYRVEKLFEMAHHRLSTIAIGSSICVVISMLVCPVWAGNELHNLVKNNMEKLADSLDGCVADYFNNDADANNTNSDLGYKCVLNSKATGESLANFARWEPAHGGFSFRHPWKQYLKVGASLRSCAYCIEALDGIIKSDSKTSDILKNHFSKICVKLSSKSSAVLKELAIIINTTTKSTEIDFVVEEMNNAVQELQNSLKSLSKQPIAPTVPKLGVAGNAKGESDAYVVGLVDIVPLVTVSSLLIEIAARTENIANSVKRLANEAEFRVESGEKSKKSQSPQVIIQISHNKTDTLH